MVKPKILGEIQFSVPSNMIVLLVFDDEPETDKHDTSPSFGNNEENYELGHLEFLDQTVDRRDYAQPEESLDEKMPASIIKHKQKLAMMTDKELADRLGSFDETKLRQMAWRHGYGKMSSYYWDRVQVGKKDVSKYKEGDMIGVNWNWYSMGLVIKFTFITICDQTKKMES